MLEVTKGFVTLKSVQFFFYTILFFMFYWFILCPIIFSRIYGAIHSVFYWIIAFIVFCIIILIPIYLTFCKKENESKERYKVSERGVEIGSDDDSNIITLNELEPITINETNESSEINIVHKNTKNNEEIDKMFPRCSIRHPQKTKSLIITQKEIKERPLSTPLTPRELFFQDLFANIDNSSSSVKFPEESVLTPTSDGPNNDSTSEFFIANVPADKTCTSIVEMFIPSENCASAIEVTANINQ